MCLSVLFLSILRFTNAFSFAVKAYNAVFDWKMWSIVFLWRTKCRIWLFGEKKTFFPFKGKEQEGPGKENVKVYYNELQGEKKGGISDRLQMQHKCEDGLIAVL